MSLRPAPGRRLPLGVWADRLVSDLAAGARSSSPPSPEEVQSWAQSFDKLMRSPAGRGAFREFLRTEYSEENMLFWLACEELKAEANQHAVDEKARLIYEDYVSILSPKEVRRGGDVGAGGASGP